MAADQDFETALRLHRSGRLQNAAELYQSIIQADPRHAGARHLLGVLASQAGQFALAAELIGQAIALVPHVPAFHINLGNALLGLHRWAEAEQSFRAANRLDARLVEGWLGLGMALASGGQPDGALEAWEQALALAPDLAPAWVNIMVLHMRHDRFDAALAACRQALALRPGDAALTLDLARILFALGNDAEAEAACASALRLGAAPVAGRVVMGRILRRRGRISEAREQYGAALEMAPADPGVLFDLAALEAETGNAAQARALYDRLLDLPDLAAADLYNLGNALAGLEDFAAAAACHRRVLDMAPDLMPAWNNLGVALRELSRLDEAEAVFAQARDRFGEQPSMLSNHGLVLKDLGRVAEAEAACRRAADMQPGLSEWSNLGLILAFQDRMAEALACFRAALAVAPDDPDATFHLGVALLHLGRYDEGWAAYEARWDRRRAQERRRPFPQPQWRGEELAGRTILLHAEQGFGDSLQFIRYAPLVAARGGRVVAEVQAPLARLLRRVGGIAHLVVRGEPLPDFALHCPLMSLPLACATRLDSIPGQQPYLQADPVLAEAWRARVALASPGGRRRVGLVWAGEPRRHDIECFLTDSRRSRPLSAFAPLFAQDGLDVFSLQKGEAAHAAAAQDGLIDLMDAVADFDDTAALIHHLDLVIAVDTSVAHLAAAMGKPTWVLSRHDGCWRWLSGRSDSPWYPSVRLYRQQGPGNDGWAAAFAALFQDLAAWVGRA